MKLCNYIILFLGSLFVISSCSKKHEISSITGWEYNNPKNGGFEAKLDYKEQATGPGLMPPSPAM